MANARKQQYRPWAWCLAALLAAGMAVALSSCSLDSGFNSVDDYDVVITRYTPDWNYAGYTTYAMPDSVVYLIDPEDDDAEEPDRTYDELILETVANNMEALGYTRETDPETNGADIFMLVSITTSDWLAYSSYGWWGYWGWYPGWGYYPGYGPGWGSYYPPCYGCGTQVYSYSTGTIFTDMLDPDEPIEDDEEGLIVWTGALNGVLSSGGSGTQNRITNGINQAFKQSSYLGTTS